MRRAPVRATVTIRLHGTLAHFVAPVPAMNSHGALNLGLHTMSRFGGRQGRATDKTPY